MAIQRRPIILIRSSKNRFRLRPVEYSSRCPFCREPHGGSERQGGDGRFSRHRIAGVRAQAGQGEIASLSGVGDDQRYFQISVPVQPGNSGGVLVDAVTNGS